MLRDTNIVIKAKKNIMFHAFERIVENALSKHNKYNGLAMCDQFTRDKTIRTKKEECITDWKFSVKVMNACKQNVILTSAVKVE